MCVPVLILNEGFCVFQCSLFGCHLESQTVVALTATTAETSLVVVVALVVISLVVTSLVVAALVEVVSVVEAVGVTIVVATAATIIVVPTKEDPGNERSSECIYRRVLEPGLSLTFLPFATSAASTIWKEKPSLSVHLTHIVVSLHDSYTVGIDNADTKILGSHLLIK